jgi:hypothetical protein
MPPFIIHSRQPERFSNPTSLTGNIFKLKCNNMDVIAFLPTVVELGLADSSA